MAEPDKKQEFRTYKSEKSSYQQPLNSPQFIGWRRISEGGVEELINTRYVSLEIYGKVIRKLGVGRKAIGYIFNPKNNIDYNGIDSGILLFTKKDKKLWHSSLIEMIEPGLDGSQIMQRQEKFNPEEAISNMLKEGDEEKAKEREDDEPFAITPEPEKAKQKSQAEYKSQPRADSEYKPQSKPVLKTAPKPAPKSKPSLKK